MREKRDVAVKGKWWGVMALALVVLLLPEGGMLVSGMHLGPYFEFPPRTFRSPEVLEDRAVFVVMAIGLGSFCGVGLLILLYTMIRYCREPGLARRRWPWWGGAALLWTGLWWWLAWAQPLAGWELQRHTFTPLWLGYIGVVSAFCWWRGGRCLPVESPRRFAGLFALSGAFWWVFEYLNRFVQNWYYLTDRDFGRLEYLLFASLSFSTVLPAVAVTQDLLQTLAPIRVGLARMWRLRLWRWLEWLSLVAILALGGVVLVKSQLLAAGVYVVLVPIVPLTFLSRGLVRRVGGALICLLAGIGLWRLGVEPDIYYPVLWVSPLLLLVGARAARGREHFFSGIGRGDWRAIYGWTLASLICGIVWEMWNHYSLVKWQYQIPFVDMYEVFEMPILGYAGYIPFGWECAVVIALFFHPESETETDLQADGISTVP